MVVHLSALECLRIDTVNRATCCIILIVYFFTVFVVGRVLNLRRRRPLRTHRQTNSISVPLGNSSYTVVRGPLQGRGWSSDRNDDNCAPRTEGSVRATSSKDSSDCKMVDANAYKPPLVSLWPHRPIYARLEGSRSQWSELPLVSMADSTNTIYEFETALFKGRLAIRIQSPQSQHCTKKKRSQLTSTCIQGQFKQPLSFNEVLTGQLFGRPLSNRPPQWLASCVLQNLQQMNLSTKHNIYCARPFMLAPLVAAAQTLNVALCPSTAPDVSKDEVKLKEDTSLLGGIFATENISAQSRKLIFSDTKCLKQYHFSPEHIHTFYFDQNVFNIATFEFDVGIGKVDIAKYLNRQPIEINALLRSHDECSDIEPVTPAYLWRVQIWNERVV